MNRAFEQFSDVKIIECDDFLSALPELAATGNILLITSQSFSQRGLVKQVVDTLGSTRVHVFDQVTPNPEKAHLSSHVTRFMQSKITHVIALGGGSVIDAAKIFCALLSHPTLSLDDLLSVASVENKLNLIAVPTTSGTGAEVTPFATVWQSDIARKYSLYGIRPNVALLDPSLTLSLSVEQTLYPALDALSHALESQWNVNNTEQSSVYAVLAINLVCDNLPLALVDPSDLVARKNLQVAATCAGIAISITKTALAHAMSYPVTLQFGVPHGLACSFTLLSILNTFGSDKLNLSADLAVKVAQLLESLDLPSELERFVDWKTLTSQLNITLDPSRAGNFVVDVEDIKVMDILQGAKA
ncbi:phosphonoacetaldehyde reductase [Aliiglaciecola litoralis]|uniref:Alcohol dehydrogenase n=1 Tax=Aliiglaciecola litoralis TaxID=582857 RepID=A0ABP3WW15_9ALTE